MNKITVFSKPWQRESLDELGTKLVFIGFEGLELAVRDGYQVTPENVEKSLAAAAKTLGNHGLLIHSVASELTEPVFAGCANAGIPLVRIQVPVDQKIGYFASKDAFRKIVESNMFLLERYGVAIAVQIHCGGFLARSTEVMEAIRDYDPKHVCIVWDVGHAAIGGEDPAYGLSTCGSHLSLANFKNFRYVRNNGVYDRENCCGEDGIGSWPNAVSALRKRGYSGALCLSAQYGKSDDVEQCATRDVNYLRSLLAG